MFSWSELQTEFQNLADDDTATILTFAKTWMNHGIKVLQNDIGIFTLEKTVTGTTSTSDNFITLPVDCIRPKQLYVTVNSIKYVADEIFDLDIWSRLSATSTITGDQVKKMFRIQEKLHIWPLPASANTYTLIYEAENKDLVNDDYADGTISDLTNAASAVTGSSTTFTAAMVDRFLKITSDGQWYKINAFTSATAITLLQPYQGITIAAGAEIYKIGEIPNLPSGLMTSPIEYALWKYHTLKHNKSTARVHKSNWDELRQWGKATYSKRFSQKYIPSQRGLTARSRYMNPNYYPRTIT